MKFDNIYDKIMTEYVEDYMTHEMATRVHDSDGISPTLTSGEKLVSIPVLTAHKQQNGRHIKEDGDPSFTLTTNDSTNIFDGKKVRRLTPLECERLQGFQKNYTKFGADGESISDTQRYKCLGNAVTVPVIEFILERLK